MARCWSCGSEIPGGLRYVFTCPTCEEIQELKGLRQEASHNLTELAQVQQRGFEALSDKLSEVASVIEWGFEEINWELQQQTEILRSIDHTLKTPSQTQANEWRQMAEELRNRGVLSQSEELFLKALGANPLDYRLYVGLAQTYLPMEKFDKARTLLEKSLPHAPLQTKRGELKAARERVRQRQKAREWSHEEMKAWLADLGSRTSQKPTEELSDEEVDVLWEKYQPKTSYENYLLPFDYKSYSYRLIGHIYACEENYHQAASALEVSVKLSPSYWDGHYDYAQYCALTVNKEDCLASLQKAILGKPFYFYLAQKEKNFEHLRGDVRILLGDIKTKALDMAEGTASSSEDTLREAEEAVSRAQEALRKSREEAVLESTKIFDDAKSKFQLAKDKIQSGDYTALLATEQVALQSRDLAIKAREKANEECRHYEYSYESRRFDLLSSLIVALSFSLLGGMVGFAIGGIVGFFSGGIWGAGSMDCAGKGAIIGAVTVFLAALVGSYISSLRDGKGTK